MRSGYAACLPAGLTSIVFGAAAGWIVARWFLAPSKAERAAEVDGRRRYSPEEWARLEVEDDEADEARRQAERQARQDRRRMQAARKVVGKQAQAGNRSQRLRRRAR